MSTWAPEMDMNAKARLRAVKSLHTIIWVFFVGCILAIPVEASLRRFDRALLLIACVMLEVVTLALNSWHCPLSGVAARYTADRRANFDIYLPAWLAAHTKPIFGALFVLGVITSGILRCLRGVRN
jgi:hypothetical protein